MDKITERQLHMLVKSDNWDSIHNFVEVIIKKWNNVPIKAEDEFNTLYNLAHRDGKIEGLREFINSLEEISWSE